ncbi:putative Integrase catalytic domain [Desulfovibrio sp. X2]|uniref:tyrosine-type recombinase/integrase n=1 Tax=Desulfovibrio sp. X2 TaxID=941449 RepID=UPI000358DBE0|nr:phage integrase N-terminal domain-containing protein [Desulfovibrio sp. X2]EPR37098.1 putative Integrase catalytic domain [Desulfovibrio sp. X2]
MAGKSDSLLYALRRARLTGSGKTITNNKKSAELFVRVLRDLGYGVQKWTNLTNRHVADAVQYWQDQDLSPGTIKNYVAGVRSVCRAYGNDTIHQDNGAFGMERRVYVSNRDKSLARDVYAQAVATLRASTAEDRQRMALMLEFQRTFGMRVEESMKFNPIRDDEGERVHIHRGTKGGRPRWCPLLTDEQRDLLERARNSGFYSSPSATIIPKNHSERTWRNTVYGLAHDLGLTKAQSGATMHGLRHAYAHERYEGLTGFKPPVLFAVKDDYIAHAQAAAGDMWRERDQLARAVIREELGHSPDRADIDGQYLGSVVR